MVIRQKLLISLLLIFLGAIVLRFVRDAYMGQSSTATLAASLLPVSNQPLQIGAQLSPDQVEIGSIVTLTLLLRNNENNASNPTVILKLPSSLQLEGAELAESLIFNAAEQTLHWYPQLAENGDVLLQELRLLVLKPTTDGQQDEVSIQLLYEDVQQMLYLPFWAGLALQPMAAFSVNDLYAGVDQQLLFTNQSVGQPPLTYLWSFGDGNFSSSANPTHSFKAPGDYLVELTVTNPLGEVTQALPITVGFPPTARLMVEDNIHAGTPFIAQAFADGGETTFEWQLGDGSQQTGFWVEHRYATPSEYVLTLNATNPFGNTIVSTRVMVQEPIPAVPEAASSNPAVAPVSTIDVNTLDIQLEANADIEALSLPNQLLGYINLARQTVNLPPLAWSYQLSRAAQGHTEEAAFGVVNGHIGTNGSTPYDRVRQANYVEGFLIGEATAWGFNSAQAAVQFWLDSPEHRPLILSQEADQVGVGQSTNYETDYVWYWTVEIASYELPETAVVYGGAAPLLPATATPTPTLTPSLTATPLITATLPPSSTPTAMPTGRPTITPTITAQTATPTVTPTIQSTPTPAATVVITSSGTITPTIVPDQTPTPSPTPTPEESESSRLLVPDGEQRLPSRLAQVTQLHRRLEPLEEPMA